MNLHLHKLIFIIALFFKTFEEYVYSYTFYIYRKVIFIIVKDNSECFIYYEVYIYQKVILCFKLYY